MEKFSIFAILFVTLLFIGKNNQNESQENTFYHVRNHSFRRGRKNLAERTHSASVYSGVRT